MEGGGNIEANRDELNALVLGTAWTSVTGGATERLENECSPEAECPASLSVCSALCPGNAGLWKGEKALSLWTLLLQESSFKEVSLL